MIYIHLISTNKNYHQFYTISRLKSSYSHKHPYRIVFSFKVYFPTGDYEVALRTVKKILRGDSVVTEYAW